MEGKTHFFYGFMIASFVLVVMSMYHTNNLNYLWLLLGNIIVIFIWEVADDYDRKGKEVDKEDEPPKESKRKTKAATIADDSAATETENRSETSETAEEPQTPAPNPAKKQQEKMDKEKIQKRYTFWNAAAWCCNLIMMLLTVITSNFITDSRASSVYAFIGLLLGFAGSFYCDMDTLIFSIEAHRNPFTHSYLLPFIMWWYAFLVLPLADASLIIFPAMFCSGGGITFTFGHNARKYWNGTRYSGLL